MIDIAGYQILDLIHEGRNSVVYRGKRLADLAPIVVKVMNIEYPSREDLARFRHEFEILRRLTVDGAVSGYSLEQVENRLAIVMEDFGGEPLHSMIQAGPLPVDRILSLGIQIAAALGQIHQNQVIHKDINTSNVLINDAANQLKIIDFGISTVLNRESTQVSTPTKLEGTLAYISPEQTGRMNRDVDYRTDYYSLGVTLYELACGQRPFVAQDALELIHAHIARQPQPLHSINPQIPQTLSDIILKLLNKTAEDRYQSAAGLQHDLQTCLDQWQKTGQIEAFALGQRDRSDRFQIPQKLYGRDVETQALLETYARVGQGSSEMMLVAGYSGIGKSALVHELYKPITRQKGYYCAGKFDQFQRNIPYSAFIQAIQDLIRQILTEDEAQITRWREEILAALSGNGQVIVDVIPEISLIIGPQDLVPELGPTETQNRFNFVLQRFINVFTAEDHPLTIFLDDLQWADRSSLRLIELLMNDIDSQHLLLIGAYRDNEVDAGHPLLLTLEELEQGDGQVSRLQLGPLEQRHTEELIADTLQCNPTEAVPLAQLVLDKTAGNPFFVNQFLTALYEDQLLTFNRADNQWRWDLARIADSPITDNVVDLIVSKIQRLPQNTQEVLQLAACIGNRFDLRILSMVNEKFAHESASDLWAAIEERLIVPIGDSYLLLQGEDDAVVDQADNEDTLVVAYRFLHDRVQQAAYSLISEDRKQVLHKRIGQLLLTHMDETEQSERLFDIVNHLNLGQALIEQDTEKDTLITLNLRAGRKAKSATAHAVAQSYLTTGINLLASHSWDMQYNLTLDLYTEAAEAAYLNTDYEAAEQLIVTVLDKAQSTLDKVRIYETRIQSQMAQHQMLEAVNTAREVLALLGVTLPENPSPEDIGAGYGQTVGLIGDKSVESLRDLPEMTDPDKMAAMRILVTATAPVYFSAPQLFPLVVFNGVQLSVTHGNTPHSTYCYCTYGVLLCAAFGDIDTGYKFGRLGLDLLEAFNARELKSKVYMVAFNSVLMWKDPVRDMVAPLLEGYQSGLETGDLEYAGLNLLTSANFRFVTGQELSSVEQANAAHDDVLRKIKQEKHRHTNALYWQIVLNLLGESDDPTQITGKAYSEDVDLPQLQAANDLATTGQLFLYKAMLNYLFYDTANAKTIMRSAEELAPAMMGTAFVPFIYFYYSLILLAEMPSLNETEQETSLEKVTANQELLANWAHHAPANYQHRTVLVEAERSRVQGDLKEAMAQYDEAIALAQTHQFMQDEALANELAARFYLDQGRDRIAQVYLQEAHYAYRRWGAKAKVSAFEAAYPHFRPQTSAPRLSTTQTTQTGTVSTTGTHISAELDFNTILKASQTISSEIVLDRLLEQLMRITMENAGAEKGFLILEQNGKWVIEAEGQIDQDSDSLQVTALEAVPVEGNESLPTTIINFVIRTTENVVVG
ncbi:MAG: serine/threonine-protein kinase PknK, partial [Chloroflexota bacterium]